MQADALTAIFSALADPTRRAILARLETGECNVTDLAAPFAMSQPAISKHIKVLENVGLVTRSRVAQSRLCRLNAQPLKEAGAWVERYRSYWEASFAQLDDYLIELQQQEANDEHTK